MFRVMATCVVGTKVVGAVLIWDPSAKVVKHSFAEDDGVVAALTQALPVFVRGALLGLGGIAPPRWMLLDVEEGDVRDGLGVERQFAGELFNKAGYGLPDLASLVVGHPVAPRRISRRCAECRLRAPELGDTFTEQRTERRRRWPTGLLTPTCRAKHRRALRRSWHLGEGTIAEIDAQPAGRRTKRPPAAR